MQSTHDVNGLLTVGEAAALCGVSNDTIKRWEKRGFITSERTPTGHRRFRRGDVERMLTSSRPLGGAA